MERIATLTALVTIVLVLGHAVGIQAFEVSYDGFSDGVYLDLEQSDGIVSGYLTGAVEGEVMGVIGGVRDQGETITITYPDESFYAGLFTLIREDGSWSHYYHDGVQVVELNSGMWVEGAPVVASGENLTSSLDVIDIDHAANVTTKPRPGTRAVSVNTKPRPGTEAISVNTKPRPGTNVMEDPQYDHAEDVTTKPRPGTEVISVNTKPRPGTEAVSVNTKPRPGVESVSVKERPGVK